MSRNATSTARSILVLRERCRQTLAANAYALRLLDYAFEQPILSVRLAERHLGCAYVTASTTIDLMVEKGVFRETTGKKRNRIFRFDALLDLFREQVPSAAEPS